MKDKSTRSKILKSMYTLISEQGYDKSSIGQIAEMTGIKKASVYYYFSSKQEILLELVQDLYQEDYAGKMKAMESNSTAASYREALLTLGKDFIASYFKNQTLRKVYAEIDIQTSRIPSLQKFVQEANDAFQYFLHQLLLHGVNIGAFPTGFDVEGNTQMLYVVLVGIDDAILYELPVNTQMVWETAINHLFV